MDIRDRMKKVGMTQVEMILELQKQGVTVQPPEMSQILSGVNTYYTPPVWYIQRSYNDGIIFLDEPFFHGTAEGGSIIVYDEAITILNEMHKCYHNGLGGNGDLDNLMNEVNALPLK